MIKWKHFPRYWPIVRVIHRSPVTSPNKSQWRGALMFYLIFGWINSSVNNRGAGDLRRHRAHYDAIVMMKDRQQQNDVWRFGHDITMQVHDSSVCRSVALFVQRWRSLRVKFYRWKLVIYAKHCHSLKYTYTFFGVLRMWQYNDVIMSAMASQITSLTIVYSSVNSRRISKKTSKLRVTGLCGGNSPVTGEFPAQMASNLENVSIL